MGRPPRRNVDYFPFYAKDGRTLFILESKYQCKGTGFFTNLLRFIADKEDHHFCIQDEGDRLYFFTKCHCDEESGLDMIEIMVKTGKLDRELWEQGKILASQAFLDSVQDAYRKRNNKCITILELRQKYGITTAGKTQTSEKPAEDTQQKGGNPAVESRKEKKRKEKDSKEKENNKKKNDFIRPYLGEFENVKLTSKEYEKLKINFNHLYKEKIENLSHYIESKGDKYRSHYATILNWDRREKKEGEKIQPKTYAQAQDAERRTMVRMLKDMKNDGKSEGDSTRDNKTSHLLSHGEKID